MPTVSRGLSSLLAVTLLVGAAAAQQRDSLSDAKARQEIAAQELEKYVKDTVAYANDLARAGRTSEALRTIDFALEHVKNKTDLPEAKREQLVRTLSERQRQFNADLTAPVVRTNPNPVVRPSTGGQGRASVDYAREMIGQRGAAVAAVRDLNDERGRRVLGALQDVDRSASMIVYTDIEFPKDWREKSERRLKSANPMTQRERELLKALNTPYDVEFNGEKLQDVIKYLETLTGQPINADPEALREANVTYEGSIVNYPKRKATLRSVLKKVLGDLGLTYIVRDESILITTPARARDTMTIRSYYVGDLVAVTDRRFGPVYGQLQMLQQVNQLMILIQETVDPESWQAHGGQGSIYFDPVTMTFVVKQSAEVHFLLGVGMRR